MAGASWYVAPRTRAGWLALMLFAAFVVSIVIGIMVEPDLAAGPLNLWGSLSFVLVIAGGALALYATVSQRERSLLALIPIVPALFAAAFELAELMFGPY